MVVTFDLLLRKRYDEDVNWESIKLSIQLLAPRQGGQEGPSSLEEGSVLNGLRSTFCNPFSISVVPSSLFYFYLITVEPKGQG